MFFGAFLHKILCIFAQKDAKKTIKKGDNLG